MMSGGECAGRNNSSPAGGAILFCVRYLCVAIANRNDLEIGVTCSAMADRYRGRICYE